MFQWVLFDLYTINTEAQSFLVFLFLLQVHPEGQGLFDVRSVCLVLCAQTCCWQAFLTQVRADENSSALSEVDPKLSEDG